MALCQSDLVEKGLTAIVPFAATGAAAKLQALADERMQPDRVVSFPGSAVGDVKVQQLPGMCLGAYAWKAGVELVIFLERFLGDSLKGLAVLELGSGTGLTAIALAKLGAKVVATDSMPDLIKLARKNGAANNLTLECCTAQFYEWGAERRHAALRRPFDLVIASEVTALQGGQDGLLATLLSLVGDASVEGRAPPRIVLAETHRNTQQPLFWKRAEEVFHVEELASIEQSDAWNTADRQEPVKIFELRPLSQATETLQRSSTDTLPATPFVPVPKILARPEDLATAAQPFNEIFKDEEKLDAYTMCYDDLEVFTASGYTKTDIGKLGTYGCILHQGVPLLLQSIADHAFAGDLCATVANKVLLDLGSADGRCVISAALHFGKLQKAIGVELSSARHELAVKHRARISDEAVAERVHLVMDDILSDATAQLLADADIVYAANLRFPEDINQRLGAHVTSAMRPEREYFVLELAPLDFHARMPTASWEVSVPMNWNPEGWPVHCHHFQRLPE